MTNTFSRLTATVQSCTGRRVDMSVMSRHRDLANDPQTDADSLLRAVDRYYEQFPNATRVIPYPALRKLYRDELTRTATARANIDGNDDDCAGCRGGDCFVFHAAGSKRCLTEPCAEQQVVSVFPCLCTKGRRIWSRRQKPDWEHVVRLHRDGKVFGWQEARDFEIQCQTLREKAKEGSFSDDGGQLRRYIESIHKSAVDSRNSA